MDRSPVTDADLSAHNIIVYRLQKLTPDIPIISEENVPEWAACKTWDHFWLIDPLDGTKEFLLHNGEFTVNIAFIKSGNPMIGVIYIPVYNVLYYSCNQESWKINSTGSRLKISARISQYPVVVMSRTHRAHDDKKLFDSYFQNLKNYKIIYIGSSLKFCLVAEGVAQFYPRFSSTKIWDTAAGHSIVKSAGASVKDWNGNYLNYKNINEYFLNPGFQVSLY